MYKTINDYINYLLDHQNVKSFFHLDEMDQDRLVVLALQSPDFDPEIYLDSNAHSTIARLLTRFDRDDEIDLTKMVLNAARDSLAASIDSLITEIKDDRRISNLREMGFRPVRDQQTGEVLWR